MLMTSDLLISTLVLILRLGLIVLFVFSLVHKLRNMSVFIQNVRDYRLLAESLTVLASAAILIVELFIIFTLVIKPMLGFYLAMCVLILYALAMGVNLMRGRTSIDCGCGRAGQGQTISYSLVIRNIVLSVLAFLSAQSDLVAQLTQEQLPVTLAALVVCILLYNAINELLLNAPKLKKLRTH